ncbi:hypothetical protein N182_34800 [Sinorhizobium sp. GL2]|nr:hypothetical protein N182_34800 [Sinorhizobium sp. GL2]
MVDSAPDIAAAANELLAADNLAPHSLAAVRGMIGHGLERLVERAYRAHGVSLTPDAMADRHATMSGIYARHLTGLTSLRPGAAEAVRAVRAAGLACAVVTNKPEAFSRTILDHFGLLADMGALIGGDSGYGKKPSPDMLLAACERLGVSPDDTILIGDSGADLASARAAGIACLLVRGGYCDRPVDELGADAVIEDPGRLAAELGLVEKTA